RRRLRRLEAERGVSCGVLSQKASTLLDEIVVGGTGAAGEQQTVRSWSTSKLVDHLRRNDGVASRRDLVLLSIQHQRAVAGKKDGVLRKGVPMRGQTGSGRRPGVVGRATRIRVHADHRGLRALG